MKKTTVYQQGQELLEQDLLRNLTIDNKTGQVEGVVDGARIRGYNYGHRDAYYTCFECGKKFCKHIAAVKIALAKHDRYKRHENKAYANIKFRDVLNSFKKIRRISDGYELFRDRMNDYLARGKSEVLLPLIWDELEIVPTKVRSAIRLINTDEVTQGVWLLTEGENNYRYQAVIDGKTVALNFNNFALESSECGFEYDNEYEKKPCKHILALLIMLIKAVVIQKPMTKEQLISSEFLAKYRVLQSAEFEGKLTNPAARARSLSLVPVIERQDLAANVLKVSYRLKTAISSYAIDNLITFCDNVDSKAVVTYGRYDYSLEIANFDPASQQMYAFVRQYIRRYKLINKQGEKTIDDFISLYSRAFSLSNNQEISLVGQDIDEFFDLAQKLSLEGRQAKLADPVQIKLVVDDEFTPEINITKLCDQSNKQTGVRISGKAPQVIDSGSYYYSYQPTKLVRYQRNFKLEQLARLATAAGRIEVKIPLSQNNELAEMINWFEKNYQAKIEPMPALKQVAQPKLELKLDYHDGTIFLGVDEMLADNSRYRLKLADDNSAVFQAANGLLKNDGNLLGFEQEKISKFLFWFEEFDERTAEFIISDEGRRYRFLTEGLNDILEDEDLQVVATERFKHINRQRKLDLTVGLSLGNGDLIELEMLNNDLSLEELAQIIEGYHRRKSYVELKKGGFVNLEDAPALEDLADLLDKLGVSVQEFVKGKLQIPAYRALYLDKLLEARPDLNVNRNEKLKQLLKRFDGLSDLEFKPVGVDAKLRNYQLEGFNWLKKLSYLGFGGILADEMGLGKTLQVISLLASEYAAKKELTSLIITPASLIYNWQEEFQKFAPELPLAVVAGTKKERRDLLTASQLKGKILITSYDLLKRDIDLYEPIKFDYEILDEAQYIKNHTTAVAKAVKIIDSQQRFVLTGTPIENKLSELWSIFDYLMPGFLYTYKEFKTNFEAPIVKDNDQEVQARLATMVAPFILRRLKKEVLMDLPAKVEKVSYAEFDKKQRDLYNAQVLKLRQMVTNQDDAEFKKNKFELLAELTKLRQICCDPNLLYTNYNGESAKTLAFLDLVKVNLENSHKVLVFSQFTSLLALLEQVLTKEKITYYKITGQTPKQKRLELVDRFNNDQTQVFLISLKAGGTGLNLVGADVVIHYDPWWNQAAQNQATDRAHRIGQEHKVTVYNLISKGTIEEKILEMQKNKQQLADNILGNDQVNSSNLSKEDLLGLL